MMQMPERIFHLADIEPKKFDAITYFEKHPGKDLLYDIPTKLKTKEMILQVLIKEPSNLDYEPFLSTLFLSLNSHLVDFLTMPIWDWSDYPYHKGWIYISGHTHKNQLLMEDGIAVLADNQVGYEKKPWRFKSFSIDVAWDPVSKLSDGVHEISHDAYDAFNRNREIQATLNREGQCYCLKRGNLFMFVIDISGKKYLLDGGNIRSLDCMLSYYYDNMVEYARRVKRLFKPFHAVLEEISSIVQAYGGDGRIHGSIVDVDLLHHICLDPAGTVSFYYAEKKGDWKRFDSFEDLLKSNNLFFVPRCLGDSTENALAAVSNETKALMLPSSEMNSAAAKTTRESYARSATISKVNYLTKNNVIRIWNDAVMRNQFLLFIDANQPIGTHLSQGQRNLPA